MSNKGTTLARHTRARKDKHGKVTKFDAGNGAKKVIHPGVIPTIRSGVVNKLESSHAYSAGEKEDFAKITESNLKTNVSQSFALSSILGGVTSALGASSMSIGFGTAFTLSTAVIFGLFFAPLIYRKYQEDKATEETVNEQRLAMERNERKFSGTDLNRTESH